MTNSTFSLIVKLLIILDLPLLIFIKTKYPHFHQLYSLEKLKIILNPDKEILPSVCNFIWDEVPTMVQLAIFFLYTND